MLSIGYTIAAIVPITVTAMAAYFPLIWKIQIQMKFRRNKHPGMWW